VVQEGNLFTERRTSRLKKTMISERRKKKTHETTKPEMMGMKKRHGEGLDLRRLGCRLTTFSFYKNYHEKAKKERRNSSKTTEQQDMPQVEEKNEG
jgi:hypothetical protein